MKSSSPLTFDHSTSIVAFPAESDSSASSAGSAHFVEAKVKSDPRMLKGALSAGNPYGGHAPMIADALLAIHALNKQFIAKNDFKSLQDPFVFSFSSRDTWAHLLFPLPCNQNHN